jgi:hypothetical protein
MLDAAEPSVQEKLNLLLKYLAGHTEYPGQTVEIDLKHDYAVVCARNRNELGSIAHLYRIRALSQITPMLVTLRVRMGLRDA